MKIETKGTHTPAPELRAELMQSLGDLSEAHINARHLVDGPSARTHRRGLAS